MARRPREIRSFIQEVDRDKIVLYGELSPRPSELMGKARERLEVAREFVAAVDELLD